MNYFVQEGWLSPTEHASVSAISLRHILANPGYAPGTIAVNVTWMKKKEDSMLVKRITASTFNHFPVIQPVNSKVRHFGLPWVRLWDNRGKCYMDGKWIQCWSNALQHIPIYLQLFTSYSEILVRNCNIFPTPCI